MCPNNDINHQKKILSSHDLEFAPEPNRNVVYKALRNIKQKIFPFKDLKSGINLPYKKIDLIFWRPEKASWVNFGDELSQAVVSLMLSKHGCTLDDEVNNSRRLLAIGSILHYANDGDVIWGSGVNGHRYESSHKFSNLDVRSVRGPYTQEFLERRGIKVPNVYGDPGLLISKLVNNRFALKLDGPISVISHYSNKYPLKSKIPVSHLDPRRSWNSVVSEIVNSSFVISSSLHGLVVADSFGIPSRLLLNLGTEGIMKYRDYYEGTGRPNFQGASSIDEAIEMGGELPPVFDQEKLLNSFPYDLWGIKRL